ncbi:MAG TPA: hypothetical protein VN324_08500, partial [Quisquiliibacterium sp.]|nr:hypothetical protein [Quisquiliibacterium sp.]
MRHPLLALLVLLQLLVPYLHSHASPGAATGLHVHLPSLGIAAVGEAPGEPAPVLPRLARPAG